MKVFVVITHDIESDTIHGIFSSEFIAQKMAIESGGEIEEWPLDIPPDQWVRYQSELYARSRTDIEVRVHETTVVANGLSHWQQVNCVADNWIGLCATASTKEKAKANALKLFKETADKEGWK